MIIKEGSNKRDGSMINKKLICIGLIVFGVAICSSLVAQSQDSYTKTATVTLSMTLEEPLKIEYNPGQIELKSGGPPGIYSSNPSQDERNDPQPIYVNSIYSKWQLDVYMSNGGKLSTASKSTVNALKIYIFGENDIDETTQLGTSNWQPTGVNSAVESNMLIVTDSDPNVKHTYYARYDIPIDPDDPAGTYTGEVTWTLSSPL